MYISKHLHQIYIKFTSRIYEFHCLIMSHPFPSPGSARLVSHLPHWRLRALWRQWQQRSRRKRRLRQIDQLLGSVVTGCLRQMLWAWQKVLLRKAGKAGKAEAGFEHHNRSLMVSSSIPLSFWRLCLLVYGWIDMNGYLCMVYSLLIRWEEIRSD